MTSALPQHWKWASARRSRLKGHKRTHASQQTAPIDNFRARASLRASALEKLRRLGSNKNTAGHSSSVAVEYDHLFMGSNSHSFTSTGVLGAAIIPVGGVFRTDSISQDVDLITARINYRFNWGGGPVIAKY
jgi:hypothetical protein